MSGIFSKPKLPPPPPSPVTQDSPDVRAAGEAERKRLSKNRGRTSTILTSGLGVQEEQPGKTLLGQ